VSDPIYDSDKDPFDEARRVQSESTDEAYQKYLDKYVDEGNPDTESNFRDAFVNDKEIQDLADTVDKTEEDEVSALNKQLGEHLGNLEDDGVDYYKKGLDATVKYFGGSTRKKLLLASGIVGLVLGMGGFLGFLNTFRLKSFMENVNFHAFSRYNAAIDRRSDAWSRAYFKTRMLEWGDGERKADADGNTFFRSNKVDTNHPFTDWYRTMRTSKFEQNLLEKHGIRFTSVVDGDGNVRPGRIDIRGRTVDIIPDGLGSGDFVAIDDLIANNRTAGGLDALIGDIDGKVTATYDNDRDARKAIKKAVDLETKRWQVIQRRHHRKAIANMTGVRDWRFFDKTRTNVENKKAEFQKKMITKVFPQDGRSQTFLLCVLGLGGCVANTDPNNPDNRRGTGSGLPADRPENDNDPVDSDGDGTTDSFNPVDGSDYDGAGRLAREGAEEIAEEAVEGGAELSEKRFRKELIERITKQFTGSLGGGGPGAIKKILDWALKFETNLSKNPNTGRSKIGDSVYQARFVSAVLAFSTVMIVADQMQSGEVDPDQLDAAMEYMNGLGQSEAVNYLATGEEFPANVGQTRGVVADGGQSVLDQLFTATAMAQGEGGDAELVDKCKTGEPFDKDDVVPFCEGLKANGGSRITGLEDAWNKYVTDSPLGAIISGYRELKDNAITGFFMNIVDALGDVAAKVITPILEATGLANVIGDVAGWLAERVLSWIGVMPCITGTEEVGGMAANCALAGATGTAEAATRAAGGVLSVVGSSTYEYSRQLAVEYMDEQRDFMSTTERYFSLDSPQSYASQFLGKMSQDTSVEGFASLLGVKSILASTSSLFSNLMSGKALAAEGEGQYRDTTIFSGVDRYGIARECIELDPLDPDYLIKSTNNPALTPNMATLGNDEAYSAALYAENGDSLDEGELQRISQTYNCVALDNVVKGGLGYVNGYAEDNGYESSGDSATGAGGAGTPTAGGAGGVAADPIMRDATEPCPSDPDVTDQGVTTGLRNGVQYSFRLCRIMGMAQVNVMFADSFLQLFRGARNAGLDLGAGGGSFLSSSGAIQRWSERCGSHPASEGWDSPPCVGNRAAPPGRSYHEVGLAVDLTCNGASLGGGTTTRDTFNPNAPCMQHVIQNSPALGLFLQCEGRTPDGRWRVETGCESWHISPTGG
jgi:hypothetical protein